MRIVHPLPFVLEKAAVLAFHYLSHAEEKLLEQLAPRIVNRGGIPVFHVLPVGVHEQISPSVDDPVVVLKALSEPEMPHAVYGPLLGILESVSSVEIVLVPGMEAAYDRFHHAATEVVFLPGEGFFQEGNEKAETDDEKENEDDKRGKRKVAEDTQEKVRIFFGGARVWPMFFPELIHASRILSRKEIFLAVYSHTLEIF
jgi:hypothetical protein